MIDKIFCSKAIKYVFLLLTLIAVFLSVLIVNLEYSTNLEIFYYGNNSSTYEGTTVQVFWDFGEGYSEQQTQSDIIYKRHVSMILPDNIGESVGIRIDFSNFEETISIASVEFRNGWMRTLKFTPEQLAESGDFYNVLQVEVRDDHITIVPQNNDPIYVFHEDALNQIKQSAGRDYMIKLFYLAIIWITYLIVMGVWYAWDKRERKGTWFAFWSMMLMIAGIAVLFMALMSRTYGHPDEDETRGAIDYYLSAWKLPNLSSEKLYNVFSNYGTTRLNELSVYYFLAGKTGVILKEIFSVFSYYRMFNVILLIILIVFFVKFGRKNPWLIIPIGLTPQVWYIFSYATSDAWDYFLSYLLIAFCCVQNGCLMKCLEKPLDKRSMPILFGYGVGFGLLLMGKSNFYTVFVLALVIFLFLLVERKDKKLLIRYMLIVGSCILTYGFRKAVDYVVYGTQKAELYRAVKAEHVSQAIQQMQSFREMGMSFLDTYDTYQFGKYSFRSFTGLYGWMTESSGIIYYKVMGLLYLILIVYLIYDCVVKREKRGLWKDIMIAGVMLLSYVISAYHSWNKDFQAQGRYLFPILLGMMYLGYRHKDLFEHKAVRWIISIIMSLSLYSFIRYGIYPLMA